MFEIVTTIRNEVDRVRRAAQDAARRSLRRTAFLIWQTAGLSIHEQEGPSQPGTPPHTHNKLYLLRALKYAVEKENAVIGTQFSKIATAGEAHEFGVEFHGRQYPARPFMAPALEQNLDVFASDWQGSISN